MGLCTIVASPLLGQVVPGVPAEDRSADLERFRARVHADMDALLQRYETAWGRRDARELAALFTADAGLVTEGRVPVQGRDQIARTFQSVLPRMRWGRFTSRTVDINDDVAYVMGTAELEWATAAKDRYRITIPFALTARRAFPDPWLIAWQRFDANITLPSDVLALVPGARQVRRAEGEVWAGDVLPRAERVAGAQAEFIAFTVRGRKRLADGRALATWLVWVSADDWRHTMWLAKNTQQVVQMVTPLDGGGERWLVRIYPAEP